jgi:hypothetical protein
MEVELQLLVLMFSLLVASASAVKLSTYGDCDWECGKTGNPEEQWRSYGYPHRGADLKKPLDNQQRWDTYLPDFAQQSACNCASFVQKDTLPYGQTDYGVAGGIAYHSETMGLANERWARQNAGVQGQQDSDVWRNKGLKAAWGQGQTPEVPKIAFAQKNTEPGSQHYGGHLPYGQTDYGAAEGASMHAATTEWNDKWLARQKAAIKEQSDSDKWRAVKDTREIPQYYDASN